MVYSNKIDTFIKNTNNEFLRNLDLKKYRLCKFADLFLIQISAVIIFHAKNIRFVLFSHYLLQAGLIWQTSSSRMIASAK